jgi:5,5'-dehydrodivanillate O-demethylase oxygenase subunit
MNDERAQRRGERLQQLAQCGPGTEMGALLRTFWQPVAVARDLAAGQAQALRILGEDLTLYRGEAGRAHLVGARCAHRLTLLHTGWVEGDDIRCMYHGWQYDGTGACVHRPAERDAQAPNVRIPGYPVTEYGGLIFAYLGPGEPPAFDLPRKDVFERPGALLIARKQVWDCNWFQTVENSLDAVHVSFVHAWGRGGRFIENVTQAIPELEYLETEAGVRQIATRGAGNVRISDWTFPNNNHISVPGPFPGDPWVDIGVWMVPVDDQHVARHTIYAAAPNEPAADARLRGHFESRTYNPADHHDELFFARRLPDDAVFELTNAQDYIAQRGQGTIADRGRETLGRSDAGIALLRRIFFREMEALRAGGSPKRWQRLEAPAELPIQSAGALH